MHRRLSGCSLSTSTKNHPAFKFAIEWNDEFFIIQWQNVFRIRRNKRKIVKLLNQKKIFSHFFFHFSCETCFSYNNAKIISIYQSVCTYPKPEHENKSSPRAEEKAAFGERSKVLFVIVIWNIDREILKKCSLFIRCSTFLGKFQKALNTKKTHGK